MAARKKLVQVPPVFALFLPLSARIYQGVLANMRERAESYQRCPEVTGILVKMSTPQHGALIKPFVISLLFFFACRIEAILSSGAHRVPRVRLSALPCLPEMELLTQIIKLT